MTSLITDSAVCRFLLLVESLLFKTRLYPALIRELQCHCFDVIVKRCSDSKCRMILLNDFRSRLEGSGRKCRRLAVFGGRSD